MINSKPFLLARQKLNEDINKFYHKDKVLVWAKGKYKNRKCAIREVYWDYKYSSSQEPEGIRISLFVKTERKNGKGYLDDNDNFHRHGFSLTSFEEIK